MFGTGFELLLILVVALLVLGPERLPKVARQVGFWVGRARAVVNNLREQFEEEVALDEFKRDAERLRRDADALHEHFVRTKDSAQSGIKRISEELKRPIGEVDSEGQISEPTTENPGSPTRSDALPPSSSVEPQEQGRDQEGHEVKSTEASP